MFTTFVGMAPGSAESSAPVSPETPQPPKPRQKRSQVARACDWCRVHRIKCDNHLPCSNCVKRSGQCSQGAIEVRTLPHAYRKIEHLENRVRELEQELENERKAIKSCTGLETPRSLTSSVLPGSTGAFAPPNDYESVPERKRLGEGVHIRAARSHQETWYGPSSLFYFIRRVNIVLNNSLRQTCPINRMLPDSRNKLFDESQSSKDTSPQRSLTTGEDPTIRGNYLTATQEEYFLGLYWQSFHTSLPVLDEIAFKEHYQSLWTGSGGARKPSALVDIVLALCMQFGMAIQPDAGHVSSPDEGPKGTNNDSTIAGRWHYQRCQRLLTSELESPTILTLQCHILSTVYLCSGSFPNMADSTCTLAVRTAYMLGLHLEPPQDTPQREKEMRKRLWWALYIQDSKMSMKLGRPFLLDCSDTTCGLPGDDRENATLSGSVFAPLGEDATWLTYNLENVKLFLAVRAAYTAFYKKQLNTTNATSISSDQVSRDDSNTIESHAEFLGTYIDRIEDWVKELPNVLKTKRRDHGVSFSTDFSSLEIEQFAPLWLQRQRLLLELMYHNLCINLFRPFIRFVPATTPTPVADSIGTRCAAHAITLTQIMHQVLSSTSIMTGWHEAFQWQWNAAMSLIGFMIAYPQDALTPTAREAVELSITVFEVYGSSLTTAASAAAIARDLGAQVDLLTKQQTQDRQESTENVDDMPLVAASSTGSWGESDGDLASTNPTAAQTAASTWNYDYEPVVPMQGMLVEPMDMAFSNDTQDFVMFPWLNMSGDPASQWTYS
ncbi:fungal-specific transcription factor domain-containing protein [Hypoxylon fuscum]|nr:fungal-specific transcription factor domain-containing protein [Hypoxylon fuscum]